LAEEKHIILPPEPKGDEAYPLSQPWLLNKARRANNTGMWRTGQLRKWLITATSLQSARLPESSWFLVDRTFRGLELARQTISEVILEPRPIFDAPEVLETA
jgi:hypothetical protein